LKKSKIKGEQSTAQGKRRLLKHTLNAVSGSERELKEGKKQKRENIGVEYCHLPGRKFVKIGL